MMKMLRAWIICSFLNVLAVTALQNQSQEQKPQFNSVIQKQSQGQMPQINSMIQNQTQGQKRQLNSIIQNQTQGQKPQINSVMQNQIGGQMPQINSLREMYKVLAIAKSQAYLNAHNAFRQKIGVPPLQWDTKLEVYAHNYASKCANDCALKHSYGPYGENIFWEQYAESTPAEIVKRFTDEQVNYDIQTGECKCHPVSNKCMCGHFTAVIWKSTERVGCAEVSCNGEKGILVVCSYDPPGNTVGQNPLQSLKQ